jgi:hypothetical protein
MTQPPPLGPRALASYRRLRTEIHALKGVLDYRKPSGVINEPTINALESVRHRANKLFCRHAELPWFPRISEPVLSQADFAILVARLAAALRQFETLHDAQFNPWRQRDDEWDDEADLSDDDDRLDAAP